VQKDTFTAVEMRRSGLPADVPAWIGIGPLGLWPLSPPFPVRITLHLGEPIRLDAEGPVDPRDRGRLAELHALVRGSVQSLIERARREEAS